ncbi:MAG: hypothetical protein J6O55_00525 [Lachnospiraceae bacterium]|nr:hypothetical protein [Lachnospiraceae bacterium]
MRDRLGLHKYTALLMLSAVFISSLPLFLTLIPEGIDMRFHLMRIQGVADAILEGQIPAVIFPNAMYGHGYLGALYPETLLYPAAALRLCGIPMIAIWKIVAFCSNAATFAACLFAWKRILKDEGAAAVGAFLYTLSPLRIAELYYRGALGEILALIFLPFVLSGMYAILMGEEGRWWELALGMTGILESHVLTAVFATGICLFLIIVLFRNFLLKKRFLAFAKAVSLSLLLNLGFILPFFYYKGQKLKFDEVIRTFSPAGVSISIGNMLGSFPRQKSDPTAALDHADIRPGIGYVGLLSLILAIAYIVFVRSDELLHRFASGLLILTLLSVYVASDSFPWESLKKLERIYYQIRIIQHPWRFLMIAVLLLSLLAAFALRAEFGLAKRGKTISFVLIFLTLITVLPEIDLFISKENEDDALGLEDVDYASTSNIDYAPYSMPMVREMKEDREPVASYGVEIENYAKKGTSAEIEYSVKDSDGGKWIRFPLLYYRGYTAFDQNGKRLNVNESEIGTVSVDIPEDSAGGSVRLHFAQPWFNYLSATVSIIAALCCGAYALKRYLQGKRVRTLKKE